MKNQKLKKRITPWLFLLPALFVYCAVVIFPIIQSIGFSFYDYSGIGEMKFSGITNYLKIFKNSSFRTAIRNNIWLMLGGTCIQMIMGLGL